MGRRCCSMVPSFRHSHWRRLRRLLADAADVSLVVLDTTLAEGSTGEPLDAVRVMGRALSHGDSSVSSLISVRLPEQRVAQGPPPFTGLLQMILDAQTGSASALTPETLFRAMQSEEVMFADIPAAGCFLGQRDFEVVPAAGPPSIRPPSIRPPSIRPPSFPPPPAPRAPSVPPPPGHRPPSMQPPGLPSPGFPVPSGNRPPSLQPPGLPSPGLPAPPSQRAAVDAAAGSPIAGLARAAGPPARRAFARRSVPPAAIHYEDQDELTAAASAHGQAQRAPSATSDPQVSSAKRDTEPRTRARGRDPARVECCRTLPLAAG